MIPSFKRAKPSERTAAANRAIPDKHVVTLPSGQTSHAYINTGRGPENRFAASYKIPRDVIHTVTNFVDSTTVKLANMPVTPMPRRMIIPGDVKESIVMGSYKDDITRNFTNIQSENLLLDTSVQWGCECLEDSVCGKKGKRVTGITPLQRNRQYKPKFGWKCRRL